MTFSLVGNASPATGVGTEFSAVAVAARAGADWAWTRLYRALAPPVLAYLEAHGAPDAEASLGVVFCHLADALDEFDGDEGAFRVLAFHAARRELDDWARLTGRIMRRGPTLTRIDGLPPVSPALEQRHVQAAVARRRAQLAAVTAATGATTPDAPAGPAPRRRLRSRRRRHQ